MNEFVYSRNGDDRSDTVKASYDEKSARKVGATWEGVDDCPISDWEWLSDIWEGEDDL